MFLHFCTPLCLTALDRFPFPFSDFAFTLSIQRFLVKKHHLTFLNLKFSGNGPQANQRSETNRHWKFNCNCKRPMHEHMFKDKVSQRLTHKNNRVHVRLMHISRFALATRFCRCTKFFSKKPFESTNTSISPVLISNFLFFALFALLDFVLEQLQTWKRSTVCVRTRLLSSTTKFPEKKSAPLGQKRRFGFLGSFALLTAYISWPNRCWASLSSPAPHQSQTTSFELHCVKGLDWEFGLWIQGIYLIDGWGSVFWMK